MATIIRKKTENISISLPKDVKKDAERFAMKEDMTFSQLVRQALRSYLIKNELDEIQQKIRPAFLKLGIKNDEDVEKYFS